MSKYHDVIVELSEAPDSQLHIALGDRCEDYLDGNEPFDDPVVFLADLRDHAVYIGGASGFVMHLFEIVIGEDREWEERLEEHPDSHRNQIK